MTDNIAQIINQISDADRPAVLAALLSLQQDDSEKVFAFEANMGQAPSYIASVPLGWVAQRVQFASKMPEFSGMVDEASSKIKVDSFTIEHIIQRDPDWSRQLPMSMYLAAWGQRKFSPLLIVGREKWVGERDSEYWDMNGKSVRESISTNPLGRGFCELAVGNNVDFYALDGQHRLMAIQGLQTLIDSGQLSALDQNRRPKKRGGVNLKQVANIIRKQGHGTELLEDSEVLDALRKILSEKIGVEIIPAVLKGESQEDGKFRLRNVFVDVNENAKKLTTGESVLLDEKNGFRIAARWVMGAHPLLKDRVSVKVKSIHESTGEYTTLDALVKIAEFQLGYREEFKEWGELLIRGDASSTCRPKDANDLEEGKNQLYSYFGGLWQQLPSHTSMVRDGRSASEFRGEEHDHILFRPVAQVALAEASAILDNDHEIFMDEILVKLAEQEKRGQLRLKSPDAPWRGVIWHPVDEKIIADKGGQTLCMRLFLYLLGGKKHEALQDDYAEARNTYQENPILPECW